MARRPKPTHTGLFHAREARGMSRTELVKRSGVSKQQLSRLENGHIRLRLDHLKPFAGPLGFTPEQILLWGRYPGTGDEATPAGDANRQRAEGRSVQVPELDRQARSAEARSTLRAVRKDGRHTDPLKSERWSFPASFVSDQLRTTADQLLVLELEGDSMTPTLAAGDRVILDTSHRDPSPDGVYAIRDPLEHIVVRRLQLLRSARPIRVKVISDNPNHAMEEVPATELAIVGKVICLIKPV
jgi:transcriptional regulator with XRE-family HTH domain